MTPNIDELATLVGAPVANNQRSIRAATQQLHASGVDVVWVRRGGRGSLISTTSGVQTLEALAADVVDVTGAGDAMLGAFLAGLVDGETPEQAGRLGHAAAALTIESTSTVVPDLTLDAIRARLTHGGPR